MGANDIRRSALGKFFGDLRLSLKLIILIVMNSEETDKNEVKFRRKLSDADSRVRQADRLSKAIKILQLVQGNARWDANAFASEFACSKRTIERYIQTLEFAGVPIFYDKSSKSYRLRFDFQFPVLNLSVDETLDHALGLAVSNNPEISPGRSKAVLEKIAASSNSETQGLINDVTQVVSAFDLKLVDHSQFAEQLRTLQWALIEGRQVIGTYQSPYHEREQTVTLHPYRLCFLRSAWYVFARPDGFAVTEKPHVYRAVRFRTLKLLDRRSDVPSDFNLQDFLGNAWIVWRGDKEYAVEILFSKEAATVVTETKWHHTQRIKRNNDGSATLVFQVDGLDEIIWWLLGWAPFARVKQPKELRQMLVKNLNAGLLVNMN